MDRIEKLIEQTPSLDVKRNEPLKLHTNYRVGGIAKYFISPNDPVVLGEIMDIIAQEQLPYFLLGNGSNVLVSDKDFDGVVICLKHFSGYSVNDDVVYVKAGCGLPKLAFDMARLGLSGLEFLSGVPGTLGGAVYMNAGAYNAEIKDIIISVDILQGSNIVTLSQEELDFSYRTSNLQSKKDLIVLGATLQMRHKDEEQILKLMEERRQRRVKSQPYDMPCAGSVFRNPLPEFSWQLIEKCGLRGFSIGGAQVSTLHANFIVNTGDATANDILEVIQHVKSEVYKQTQIMLETEVEMVNW